MSTPMLGRATIHVVIEGRKAVVTLDRPPLNVLDIPMMRKLERAVSSLTARCDFLVFRGSGGKAFCAGAEVRDHTPDRVGGMLKAFHAIFRQLNRARSITIAAVHGYCLGGGMELATFCDFVVAADSAQFGQPEIKLGCVPPVALVTLPRLIGRLAATDLILTGRTISAREAKELGLVTRVVPEKRLSRSVESLVNELNGLSPAILRMARGALRRIPADDFDRRLAETERLYLGKLAKTEDAKEGVQAFLEKRVAVWKGR
ncbi:MAG TPA: enoyl-CoA hydratase/isomerase family protein [Candidatus Acidoferrales bacterium]|nr:enoyl-CoA hydratase/isomerase family protein [Candidatus Acidoferrales bacterium]